MPHLTKSCNGHPSVAAIGVNSCFEIENLCIRVGGFWLFFKSAFPDDSGSFVISANRNDVYKSMCGAGVFLRLRSAVLIWISWAEPKLRDASCKLETRPKMVVSRTFLRLKTLDHPRNIRLPWSRSALRSIRIIFREPLPPLSSEFGGPAIHSRRCY